MRRREYVTAVGSSVGALTATGSGRAQQRRLERVSPADGDTAVRPGGELVFEAAATPGVDPTAVEWWIDGRGTAEIAPNAPFWSYTHRTGNPAAHGQFDERGTYEVVAAVDGAAATWRVTVADDAPAAPSAAVTCDPGPDATITTRDEITVTATATDDSGDLERVLWQEGRNATYVDSADVSGAEARATYATTAGDAIWFIGGYPMMAWVVCRDGRVSAARTDGPSIEAMRDVRIIGTNAPVGAGEDLVVDAELEIDGDSTYHGFVEATLELIVGHDPTHVDSRTVEVFAGRTETVSLEFTTATVRNTQTFPVRVETRHAAAETDVTVIGTDDEGTGQLTVTDLSTNAPVTGGDWLEVTATLSNAGEGPASREVEFVVGHDPTTVDTQQVTLEAGETTTVSLGYETYPVANDDEFPVRVRTGDDSASRSVLVYGRENGDDTGGSPSFAVSISGTNAPVDGGDWLAVTATVENVGEAAGSYDVELVVGHSPEVVDSRTIGLTPGQTATVSLGYETYPVTTDDTFPVTVRSPHSSDTRTVTVYGTG